VPNIFDKSRNVNCFKMKGIASLSHSSKNNKDKCLNDEEVEEECDP
jgi:hypothetical protein